MKTIVALMAGLLWLLPSVALTAEDTTSPRVEDTSKAPGASAPDTQQTDRFVIYYLHMNRRCSTCETLEEYSREAVWSGFAQQLKDSVVLWQVLNFEDEGNEHYAEDYQLYSQSLIISKLHNGTEVEWKNLNKIWELVGEKDEFVEYVQAQITAFMKPAAIE